MTKRVSIKDRKAQDGAKGVDVFFAGSSDVEPEKKKEESTGELAKVTLYILADQVTAIEGIQLQQRKETGKKPSKSDLLIEAVNLLIQKYSNTAKT